MKVAKKIVSLLATAAFAGAVSAQSAHQEGKTSNSPAVSPEVPASIVGAIQFDLPSKATNRTYRIFVSKPLLPPPAEGYPVVMLTDGNFSFGTAAMQATLRQFGELRPALIVGVGYPVDDPMQALTLRNRDLVPATPSSAVPANMRQEAAGASEFGQAEQFHRFLVEELRPALAARYPTNANDQTLIGASLGGLFALHVMFAHTASFRSYAAISPSIWFNDRALLKEEPEFMRKVRAREVAPRVFISVGGLEQSVDRDSAAPAAVREAQARAVKEAGQIDNSRGLADRLAMAKNGRGYEVLFHEFEGETHTSVGPVAISRALTFALKR
jgi:hypothetical protein